MKKLTALILCLFLLFGLCGSAFAAEDVSGAPDPAGGFVLTFDGETNYEDLFGGSKNDVGDVSFNSEKKCLELEVFESTDPLIELCFGTLAQRGELGPISADEYKCIQFGIRFDAAAGREGSFYFRTTAHDGYDEHHNILYIYKNTKDFQYVNVLSAGKEGWSGDFADCRFDMLTNCTQDVLYELYYIGFFRDEAAANAYGDAWLNGKGVDPNSGGEEQQGGEAGEIDKGPVGLLVFNKSDEVLYELFETNTTSQLYDVSFDSGKQCYTVEISAGDDPFVELNFDAVRKDGYIPEIKCSEYKVLQIALAMHYSDTNGTGTMYFQTSSFGGYTENRNIHYTYKNTPDVQIINVDLGSNNLWEGTLANSRFDMVEAAYTDTSFDIYYMAFFADMETAEAYGAEFLAKGSEVFPATAVPTGAPTAALTAAPTDAPSEATEDATISGEFVTSNCGGPDPSGKSRGGGKAVIIAVAVVAVAAAAAVVAVISKKKKNNPEQK